MSAATDSAASLRSQLLDDALLLIAVISVPATALSVSRAHILGWLSIFSAQLLMLGLIWCVWLARKLLSFELRIGFLLVILAVIGVSGYIQLGLTSQSGPFILLFLFLAALFLDGMAALRASIIITCGLLLVAWGAISGTLVPAFDFRSERLTSINWLVHLYVIVIYGGSISYLGWRLLRDLLRHQSALAVANDQLVVRTRQAESVSELKSAILTNLGHEFRTPLGGVLGITDLLQSGVLSAEESQPLLDELRRSALHLGGMLDRMLDFGNLQSGSAVLHKDSLALHELAENALEAVRPQAEAKGLSLHLDCAADVPGTVFTDGPRLKQLLHELLSNAVAFTTEGRIDLHLATEAGDPARIRIELADTGCGIAPEAQASVFEPFFQVDGSATRKVGGNGLGLAICKRIVELFGGSISLASSPAGTRFSVSLPLEPADHPPHPVPAFA